MLTDQTELGSNSTVLVIRLAVTAVSEQVGSFVSPHLLGEVDRQWVNSRDETKRSG